MKNILLLYKKLYQENKTIVILYLLLLIIATTVLLGVVFKDELRYIERDSDVEWMYSNLLQSSWIGLLTVASFSFVISIHWGIRHFNYSPQSYQYNTLPISIRQKFGFILSYVFVLLPVVHILLLSTVFLGMSSINVAALFDKTSWELFAEVIKHGGDDYEKWVFSTHYPLFMAIFLLTAMFFNKMGFIKTVVAGLVIMITGMLLFVFLNGKLWETRGDFGTAQSIERFPHLYTAHYISVAVLFAAVLYTVYVRLTDKNY